MTPADKLVDSLALTPVAPPKDNPDGLPYPTHEGVLDFGGIKLRCYVLNTGQRIFHADDIKALMEGLDE